MTFDPIEEAMGHLGAALRDASMIPDDITAGHVQSAYNLISGIWRNRRVIPIGDGDREYQATL